jgi:hypothetical protein
MPLTLELAEVTDGRLALLVLVLGFVGLDFLCLCLCLAVRRFCGRLVGCPGISTSTSMSSFLEVDRDHVRCPDLCSAVATGEADSDLLGFEVWRVLQGGLSPRSFGFVMRTMDGASLKSKVTMNVL